MIVEKPQSHYYGTDIISFPRLGFGFGSFHIVRFPVYSASNPTYDDTAVQGEWKELTVHKSRGGEDRALPCNAMTHFRGVGQGPQSFQGEERKGWMVPTLPVVPVSHRPGTRVTQTTTFTAIAIATATALLLWYAMDCGRGAVEGGAPTQYEVAVASRKV